MEEVDDFMWEGSSRKAAKYIGRIVVPGNSINGLRNAVVANDMSKTSCPKWTTDLKSGVPK